MSETEGASPGDDASRPSPTRIYDYFLGGTNNFPVDREAAERFTAQLPDPGALRDAVIANRGFHGRAARWLALEGIRQFIDLGSGLPTANNTHQTVQRVLPYARVVYVDNDPAVAAHARTLLTDAGTTRFVAADLRDPGRILGHPDLRALVDFSEPTGLLVTAVLQSIPDEDDPWGLMARYMDALAPGSYLALSHGTRDGMSPRVRHAIDDLYAVASGHTEGRTREEVARFFEGLELVAPYQGARPEITYAGLWGCEDPADADSEGSRWSYCGVARKP